MAGDPHPKPVKRKRKAIRIVDAKATTRACLRWRSCICGAPSTNGHHVLSKGSPYFGDDVLENIVPLCGSGTTGCHGLIENGNDFAEWDLGCYIQRERPDVIEYVRGKLGPSHAAEWFSTRLHITV